jgi:hypothetical protein
MVGIAATGSYNIFNFLTVVILVVLYDDHFICSWVPKKVLSFFNLNSNK